MGPAGERVRVSRPTLDRWIRAWRKGGFAALLPQPRGPEPRTPAARLRPLRGRGRERPLDGRCPARPAALRAALLPVLLHRRPLALPDRLPLRPGRGHAPARSRAAGRPGGARPAADALRRQRLPVFARAAAVLGIRLVHSRAGEAASRGKVERVFGTVRGQFLVELEGRQIADLAELNRLFAAWVEGVYHQRPHSETGEAPLARFLAHGPPALPSPAELREAFLWAERRRVSKTATVELYGNRYELDAALVHRQVELLFDPFELGELEVRYEGRPMGLALPQRIARHVHPKARPETQPQPAPATGIDYLGLVEARHAAQLRRRITYAALPEPPEPEPATPEDTDAPEEDS